MLYFNAYSIKSLQQKIKDKKFDPAIHLQVKDEMFDIVEPDEVFDQAEADKEKKMLKQSKKTNSCVGKKKTGNKIVNEMISRVKNEYEKSPRHGSEQKKLIEKKKKPDELRKSEMQCFFEDRYDEICAEYDEIFQLLKIEKKQVQEESFYYRIARTHDKSIKLEDVAAKSVIFDLLEPIEKQLSNFYTDVIYENIIKGDRIFFSKTEKFPLEYKYEKCIWYRENNAVSISNSLSLISTKFMLYSLGLLNDFIKNTHQITSFQMMIAKDFSNQFTIRHFTQDFKNLSLIAQRFNASMKDIFNGHDFELNTFLKELNDSECPNAIVLSIGNRAETTYRFNDAKYTEMMLSNKVNDAFTFEKYTKLTFK